MDGAQAVERREDDVEGLMAGAVLGHAHLASAIMKVVAAIFAAGGSGGFTSASAVVGMGAGFVFHVALPLRSGWWLVVSESVARSQLPEKQLRVAGEGADKLRAPGHSSPVFRVGSGEGRVHEIQGGQVTKVGGG